MANRIALGLLFVCVAITVQVNGEEQMPRNLHKRHADLVNRLEDYNLVRPYRSTKEGEFISFDFSTYSKERAEYKRIKRAATELPFEEEADEENPSEYVTFEVDGEPTTVEVQETPLINKDIKIQKIKDDGSVEDKQIDDSCRSYEAKDSAAFVMCGDKVSGVLNKDGKELLIEPIEDGSANPDQGKTHIMYDRRSLTKRDDSKWGDFDTEAIVNQVNEVDSDRVKRGAGGKYYIETMVAVDNTMVDFHGEDNIPTYILTMMNIVNEAYHHSTLQTDITVAVIRIVMLSKSQASGMISGSPAASLRKVCTWAYKQNTPDDSNKDHHDLALFFTRDSFGPAGYAPLGSMCSMRSCGLMKDDGLLTSFVTVHEVGHTLGMDHDGQGNACRKDANKGSIMAPLVTATYHKYFWSSCSRKEMQAELGNFNCMNDNPHASTTNQFNPPSGLPGESYSLDDQCRFDFGEGFGRCTAFGAMDPCGQLWCAQPSNPFFCKTKKGPALDGTFCRKKSWCMQGSCVKKPKKSGSSNPIPSVVNGGWSEYTEFSECSFTCGTGIEVRTRKCNNPEPKNGGADCVGSNTEYQVCNPQPCPGKTTDTRAQQCKNKLSNWRYLDRFHSWAPMENLNSSLQCRLTCMSKNTGDVVVSDYDVTDGTRCSYDNPNGVCVQGKCQDIGCDNVFGSGKTEDLCGICEGDNSKCRSVTGSYTKSAKKKYQRVVVIPAGARHIEINEVTNTKHFFAVKNLRNSKFILNGMGKQSQSREFVEVGAHFVYVNDGYEEKLVTYGPITDSILLLVFSTKDQRRGNFTYKYIVPSEDLTISRSDDLYLWQEVGWSNCNKQCGGGWQTQSFECRRQTDNQVVENQHCGMSDYDPLSSRRPCNTQPCQQKRFIWETDPWEPCTRTCGSGGNQIRGVRCKKIDNGQSSTVNNRKCPGRMPANSQACNNDPCPLVWKTGEWSECSVTCGIGVMTRTVTCSIPSTQSSDFKCPDTKPEDSSECDMGTCTSSQKVKTTCVPASNTLLCNPKLREMYCSLEGYEDICCVKCDGSPAVSSDPDEAQNEDLIP
ncbi:A disintegrin and metalloproteinase with thrombospondin motifs 3-like isoform X2 [Anneissia japonica]|uniref:A disintegrin and metalloproteinase with thrombospondin motifs 3-like isoform X2 n=1 Tax=Anneissia japonica TaxID=1529436 RepID=UPI001425B5AE|nr:A disintegrin and metalloproteinase with thrombospondin motifs 3-like isoform X2 [Anneissia japonica]